MNTGETRYINSPFISAFRGKCTHRNFCIGDSLVENLRFAFILVLQGNDRRFFSAKNLVPPGSWYSIAKPTKSRGGSPVFQFMAIRSMPSPRCSFKLNNALLFLP